jgi:hypothetical protein
MYVCYLCLIYVIAGEFSFLFFPNFSQFWGGIVSLFALKGVLKICSQVKLNNYLFNVNSFQFYCFFSLVKPGIHDSVVGVFDLKQNFVV